MSTERGVSKNGLIAELTKSPHGKLEEYLPVGQRASREDSEFYAHLVSWNARKGQIRDSKTALPIVGLSVGSIDSEFSSNHLAHYVSLDVRNMERALRFSKTIKTPGYERQLRRATARWLANLESNWAKWERTAVQHPRSLPNLYALVRFKPTRQICGDILFENAAPKGSMFEAVRNLHRMSPLEAAGTIIERRIPFLIAFSALGANVKNADVVMALIGRMSATELTTNMKWLGKMGAKTNPILKAALETALGKAATSTANVLKATTAAEALGEDHPLADKLRAVQEKQIDKLGGVEGNWAVLGDKSSSMSHSIDLSRQVASFLARTVKGQVHLIFFDTQPRYIDATGKTYEQIMEASKHVTAGGGTAVGCGVLMLAEKRIDVDGIAIVSDGEEMNVPFFVDAYRPYSQAIGKQVPVYFYQTPGGRDKLTGNMQSAGLDLQTFDLRGQKLDAYSMPNMIQTMRTNRYSLIEEIMETPLLNLDVLLPQKDLVTA